MVTHSSEQSSQMLAEVIFQNGGTTAPVIRWHLFFMGGIHQAIDAPCNTFANFLNCLALAIAMDVDARAQIHVQKT